MPSSESASFASLAPTGAAVETPPRCGSPIAIADAEAPRRFDPAALLEDLDDGVLALDSAGRIVFATTRAAELLGTGATELGGRELGAVLAPRHPAADAELQRAAAGPAAVTFEIAEDAGRPALRVRALAAKHGLTVQLSPDRPPGDSARQLVEQRFRLAAHNRALTLYEQDLELRYTWLYPVHPEHDHALGRTDLELSAGESGQLLTAWKQHVIATGEEIRREVCSELASGARHYDLLILPRRDAAGGIIGVAGAAFDVTERKIAEHTLRATASRLRIIYDRAPVGIAEADLSGRIIAVNDRFCRQLGRTREELTGRTFAEITHPDDRARSVDELRRLLRNNAGSVQLEKRYLRPDGHAVWVDLHKTLVHDDGGKPMFVVAIAADITQRKRHELASRRLAAIVESSQDAIVSEDLRGRIASWNRAAERLFGYAAEEVLGKSLAMLGPPERTGEIGELFQRALRGEQVQGYETVRRCADGSLVDVAITKSPIRGADDRCVGASTIYRDISARKRAQAQQHALYELAARVNRAAALDEIFDAALEAICRCHGAQRASVLLYDADGVMRFRAWRGLSADYRRAVEGHSPWQRDEPNPQSVCVEDVSAASLAPELRDVVLREGIQALAFIPLGFEQRLLGKFMIYYDAPHRFSAGELRPAEVIAGQIAFAIQRQRTADELERLVGERTASLREAIAQMEEFSYSVSHDLRAPLRAFNGYASALLEDYGERLDATGRDYLARISRNSARMDRLIQDLLTYSRLSRRDVELRPVSLDAIVRETIQQYPEMQPPSADIELVDRLAAVTGHEPSLTQIVSNLLSNAVKFVAPGVRPRVRVGTTRVGDEVELWLEDNGIGIKPEHQARLFGLFERIHPATRFEGTGIGLAIVRRAAERMGGRAGMHSDGVNGSRFWVRLRAAELSS